MNEVFPKSLRITTSFLISHNDDSRFWGDGQSFICLCGVFPNIGTLNLGRISYHEISLVYYQNYKLYYFIDHRITFNQLDVIYLLVIDIL